MLFKIINLPFANSYWFGKVLKLLVQYNAARRTKKVNTPKSILIAPMYAQD